MKLMKLSLAVALNFTFLGSSIGCALSSGPGSPVSIGSDIFVSPIYDSKVRLTIYPKAASSNLDKIYIRVNRGSTEIITKSLKWQYEQGIDIELGGSEAPIIDGDVLIIGTSPVDSYKTFKLSK